MMKLTVTRLFWTGLFFAACFYSAIAEEKTYSIVFRTVAGDPSRYLTAYEDINRLDSTSTDIQTSQRFILIDLDGGNLLGGDKVRIKFGDSYWRDVGKAIVRDTGPADSRTVFTIVDADDNCQIMNGWIALKGETGIVVARSGQPLRPMKALSSESVFHLVPGDAPHAAAQKAGEHQRAVDAADKGAIPRSVEPDRKPAMAQAPRIVWELVRPEKTVDQKTEDRQKEEATKEKGTAKEKGATKEKTTKGKPNEE